MFKLSNFMSLRSSSLIKEEENTKSFYLAAISQNLVSFQSKVTIQEVHQY